MRLTREMFERLGLTAQRLGCRAVRTGIGYPANHTERCRERIEQELEKEPEGASRVARDRKKRARHEERGESRTLSNGRIARSLKELARQAVVVVLEVNRKLRRPHAQLNRVSVRTSHRENKVMVQTWPILTVTGGGPRESLGEERETKRARINVLEGEKSDEWVETEEEWVRIHRCPRRDLFSPHDSQDGPELSDMSKRRKSIDRNTDCGERRIVDRW